MISTDEYAKKSISIRAVDSAGNGIRSDLAFSPAAALSIHEQIRR